MGTIAQNGYDQSQVTLQIQNILRELAKCAPHPDRPDHQGPLFLNKSADLQAPAEYEGMLGSMMMESMLGSCFASVASEAVGSFINNAFDAMDYASTAYQDRTTSNYRLGQRGAISGGFNGRAIRGPGYESMMRAYLSDLPTRLNMEKHLAHELRRLYALRKNAGLPALAA